MKTVVLLPIKFNQIEMCVWDYRHMIFDALGLLIMRLPLERR